MRDRDIGVILAANYFDEEEVRGVAAKVDAVPVIVPLYVGGAPGAADYFELFDLWVRRLRTAVKGPVLGASAAASSREDER
jgi:hypothetical protein